MLDGIKTKNLTFFLNLETYILLKPGNMIMIIHIKNMLYIKRKNFRKSGPSIMHNISLLIFKSSFFGGTM